MKTLINALTKAPISEKEAESILTDLEIWIESKIVKTETKLMKESIIPLQRENDGIRSEIRLLTETMKNGFELVDQKMDFIRENLETQIAANKESFEKQLGYQQKLLWAVMTVVVGSFLKSLF